MTRSRLTRLVQTGRPLHGSGTRPVNPPVMRASTVVFDTVADWRATRELRQTRQVLSYGARGTETTFALENALAELEGGWRAKLYPTGLAAAAAVLLACLRPGDHLLITDAVYQPVRALCAELLQPLGIACEFYAADGSDIAQRLRPETCLVYAEVPGSLFSEMIDLPRLAHLARESGALLAVDNTWASGWLFNPLAHGADISILAVTKYIAGHSDVMMGAAVCNERAYPAVARASEALGQTASPDDAALALRGLRTLGARLRQHEQHALAVAQWLQGAPEVAQVFYPALPDHPGHGLWRRDFSGANGLMALELRERSPQRRDACIDALRLFGIGASWGGFESLALPVEPGSARSVADWSGRGCFVRLHIGLEDPADLIADLAQAFAAAGLAGGKTQPKSANGVGT
jgi:cystathionine beta-lyase